MWLQVVMITLSYGLTGVKSICGGLMKACGLLDLLGNAVSMQKFYHPNICWKGSVAGRKQSKRFLECSKNNFRLQVLDEPKKRRLLNLLLMNGLGLRRLVAALAAVTIR